MDDDKVRSTATELRRQHPRAPVRLDVEFRIIEEAGFRIPGDGQALNLSGGGLLLLSARDLAPGSRLVLKLSPTRDELPFHVQGEVVRTREVRDEDDQPAWEVAIRFVDPGGRSQAEIDRLVRQNLSRLYHLPPESFPPEVSNLVPDEPAPVLPPLEGDGPERRRTARVDGDFMMVFQTADDFVDEFSANLSVNGMFIRTDAEVEPSSDLEITVKLPGVPDPVNLQGTVVYRTTADPGTGKEAGLGVELTGSRPDQLEVLRRYIASETGEPVDDE